MIKAASLGCLIAIASLFSTQADALSCNALLKHGLTNVKIKNSSAGSVATKYFTHCHKDFSSLDDQSLGSVSVEILGYGGGDGAFQRSKTTEELTQWCKVNQEFAQENKELYEESREIYGQAVEAWNSCNKLASQGVVVDVEILPNNQVIDIGLRNNGPSPVEYLGVTADGFTCEEHTPTGAQATPEAPVQITGSAINISCRRAAPIAVSRATGDYEVMKWGRVTVHSAAAPFQFFFAQEETPTLPTAEALRLKSEVSALQSTLASMQSGLDNAVVAFDSTECPPGWNTYEPAFGRVVRGIDKSGTNVDPDGERLPGSHQHDSLQYHQHVTRFHSSTSTGKRPHANMEYPSATGNTDFVTGHIQDTASYNPHETRVRNVALLFCKPQR